MERFAVWRRRVQAALNLQPRCFCLVTGCPRSGTTAVMDWLATDPSTVCFAESRLLIAGHQFMTQVNRFRGLDGDRGAVAVRLLRQLINKFYAAHQLVWRKTLLDKEPLGPVDFPEGDYAGFLDNVAAMFPDSKVLFMVRDPVATVSSIVNRKWGYSLRSGQLEDMSIDKAIENWNACARVALQRSSSTTTYICLFENLISQPERESAKIWRFLSIDSDRVFQPEATRGSTLSASERAHVLSRTSERYEQLVQRAGLEQAVVGSDS